MQHLSWSIEQGWGIAYLAWLDVSSKTWSKVELTSSLDNHSASKQYSRVYLWIRVETKSSTVVEALSF